jgi:UDP-N-acetylglucosamine 2-epimerase (non-hydrolysing)
MKAPLKLVIVAGARPNFMKIAPLIKRIEVMKACGFPGGDGLQYVLVHTGQHYDSLMSGIFFRDLGIPQPDVNLDAGSGSQAVQTANIMMRFEPLCTETRPDWVVVVGDVNSTLACALVCAKLGVKVAHVEAGLRSFDRTMPEEINRVVTDSVADLLLTPSSDADENLMRQGIPSSRLALVGNVMIDALVANLEKARASNILDICHIDPQGFAYVTLHRPSNVDHPESLSAVMMAVRELSTRLPTVFPMHPRTRKMCQQFGIPCEPTRRLMLLDPIGYHDSICLTENARLVLTDSGGLQEESTYFRTPCITLRPNTERPITVTVGSNRLTSIEKLPADIDNVLSGEPRLGNIPPLWDGRASERIIEAIQKYHQ